MHAQQAVERAHAKPSLKFDTGLHDHTNFTQGGFNLWESEYQTVFPMFDGFIGWGGLGGSLFAWNPEKKLGIAYTHNAPMRESPLGAKDPRCVRSVRAVMACLDKLE